MKNSEIKNASVKKNIFQTSVNVENLLTYSNEKEPNSHPILTNESEKNENLFYNYDLTETDIKNKNKFYNSNIYDANNNRNKTFNNKLEKYNFQKDSLNKKNNFLNEFSPNPFLNENYTPTDLNKPLLSSIKNNTKNIFTNENFNISTSETKNDITNQMRNNNDKFYESGSVFNNLNNQKISNAFVLEYEKSVVNCSNICATTCTKTNFINLINVENEEIFDGLGPNNPRINPNHFVSSSKSFLILLTTVIFAAFHFVLYRKLSSLSHHMYPFGDSDNGFGYFKSFLTTKNLMSDLNIFTWRFQIISIFLFIYIFISNYLIKNNYDESLEGRFTILEDIRGKDFYKNSNNPEKKLHLIYLNFEDIITLENIKNVGIMCSSTFLLFFSSLFIPISMCLAIQYLTILIKFFQSMGLDYEKKSNNLFRLVVYLLTILGIILTLSNDFYSAYLSSKYNQSNESKETMSSDSSENNTISFLVNITGITLCVISGLINVNFCENLNKHYLSTYSALEYLVILNFNATLIMSFINFIMNTYFGNPFYSINWLFHSDNSVNIYILIFGTIAFLNIMFTIFSSVYLNNNYLKFVKILEIPFADFIAISILSVYEYANKINYHIGLINFMIVIVFLEFSNLFVKKSNPKKYDF